eukprot:6887700-Alexandrium_andersonii.AAC.1
MLGQRRAPRSLTTAGARGPVGGPAIPPVPAPIAGPTAPAPLGPGAVVVIVARISARISVAELGSAPPGV